MNLFFTASDLKKRWKNLRDCYSKYVRAEKTRTGQAASSVSRYKTWSWAQHMEHFRPFLKFAKTDSNITDTTTQTPEMLNEEAEAWDEFSETPDSLENGANNEDEGSSSNISYYSDTTPNKRRKLIENQSNSSAVDQIIKYLDKKHNEDNNNSIDFAFKGYAESVKKMSPRRQTLIKYQIAKLIMEEELKQIAELQEENRPMTSALTSNSSLVADNISPAETLHECSSKNSL